MFRIVDFLKGNQHGFFRFLRNPRCRKHVYSGLNFTLDNQENSRIRRLLSSTLFQTGSHPKKPNAGG